MIKFYHMPWSRSSGVRWLLEELGVSYELELVNIRAPGGVPERYRSIQPNKKVPAINHDGTIVTERAAISIYLSDAFPEAGLAPAIGDKARAAWLTWLVYSDSVLDPVVAAKAHDIDFMGGRYSYGSFDEMVGHLERSLSSRPYIAGDSFTSADVQIASGIHYTTHILQVLPEKPVFKDYLARVQARPAYLRATELDAELAQSLAGAADTDR